MKIFWKQLSQLIDLEEVNLHETAIKLTLAGFEVDSIEYIEEIQDTLIEISVTANRQDITGWAQIAIEIAAVIKQPLRVNHKLSNIRTIELEKMKSLNPLYEVYTCHVEPVHIPHKETYATPYIKAMGLNIAKSILDIARFINLKWGQDIKIYEIAQCRYKTADLIIRHNEEKNSNQDELNVYINNRKLQEINIGNMQSRAENIGVLLINCKQKKQIDKFYCLHAYSEMVNLIGSSTEVLIYHYPGQETSVRRIAVAPNQINKALGPISLMDERKELDVNTIAQITNSLNMSTEIIKGQAVIEVPGRREDDIKYNTDIAEEVARIYGFDKFYDTLPKFRDSSQKSLRYTIKNQIRRSLRSMGLHEIINHSFNAQEAQSHNAHIINPISQEQAGLRINLINSMIDAKKHNMNQGNYSFEAFEVGKIFTADQYKHTYKESERLSFIIGNSHFNQSTWQTEARPVSWLQAKGQAEEVFERINAHVSWSASSSSNQLIESLECHIHPRNSLYIIHNNTAIGIMSQMQDFSSEVKAKSYFAEIDLAGLMQAIELKNHLRYTYTPYSTYPKISRDFSITTSTKVSMAAIRSLINNLQNQNDKVIESVNVISEYYHNKNKKTVCLRITYRSKDRTLTSQDIKILDDMLKSKLGVS